MKSFSTTLTAPETARGVTIGPRRGLLRTLDAAERAVLVALYAWLVIRVIAGNPATGPAAALVVLLSEGLVVLFVLLRRPAREVSLQPAQWCMALLATTAPLCIRTGTDWSVVPLAIGTAMGMFGIAVQVYSKVALGRSFGCVPALRGLKTGGPYRIVRHPIYTGYLITHVSVLLMNPSFWNLAVYLICYSVQIPRMHAEEQLLNRDPCYAEYLTAVRYRLIPGIY